MRFLFYFFSIPSSVKHYKCNLKRQAGQLFVNYLRCIIRFCINSELCLTVSLYKLFSRILFSVVGADCCGEIIEISVELFVSKLISVFAEKLRAYEIAENKVFAVLLRIELDTAVREKRLLCFLEGISLSLIIILVIVIYAGFRKSLVIVLIIVDKL